MARAEAGKDAVTNGADAAWGRVVAVTDYIKKLKKYSELGEKVNKDGDSAVAGWVRETHADRFAINAGALLLNHFPLKHLNLTVGHAIARLVLAQRALIDTDEAFDLVQKQAATEPVLRQHFQDRVRYYRQKYGSKAGVLTLALDDLERHQGLKVLRDKWDSIAKKGTPLKLAGLTAVLEVVNFANILQKSDKQSKEYAQLLASGMSMASIYVSVATAINKELFTEKSLSYANAQAVGSYLGGAASLMGAFLDLADARFAWGQGREALAVMITFKSIAGGVVGMGQVITALSFSTPIIRRAWGRNGAVLFLEAVQGSVAQASVAGSSAVRSVAMRRFGITLVRLGGWQVTLGVMVIEGVILVLSPNALEEWCEKNYFALEVESWALGLGGSPSRYKTATEQNEAFVTAVKSVIEHGSKDDGQ